MLSPIYELTFKVYLKAKEMTDIPQTQNPAAFAETDDIFDVSDTPYGFSGLNTLRAAGVPNPPPPFAQRFIACFCNQTAAASQSKSAYILSSLESPCILCSLLRYFHILSKKLQKTC